MTTAQASAGVCVSYACGSGQRFHRDGTVDLTAGEMAKVREHLVIREKAAECLRCRTPVYGAGHLFGVEPIPVGPGAEYAADSGHGIHKYAVHVKQESLGRSEQERAPRSCLAAGHEGSMMTVALRECPTPRPCCISRSQLSKVRARAGPCAVGTGSCQA